MGYACHSCDSTDLPSPIDLARVVAVASSPGARDMTAEWWVPVVDWPTAQANALAWLRFRDLRCPRHATILAALVIDTMRRLCDGRELYIPPPLEPAEVAARRG